MKKFGEFIFKIIGKFLLTIMSGFVFSKLWMWFIVSTFGLNPITIIQAVGVIIIASFLNKPSYYFYSYIEKNGEWAFKDEVKGIMFYIIINLLLLGFGYIYSLFM